MPSKNRWPTKLIAISFISLILATHFWLFDFFFGGSIPPWFSILVNCNIVCLAFGGTALLWQWLKERFWNDQAP